MKIILDEKELDRLCILSETEKEMIREYALSRGDPFCQHCTCPICRDTGQCEKCGEHTR